MTLTTQRRKPAASYGTDDFAARLAARETALGIAPIVQDVTQVHPADVVSDASPIISQADVGTDSPLPESWEGVVVTSARGWFGQYTIRHWFGNRTVYVCGDPAGHVATGYWRRDRRMDGTGQGYLCYRCWIHQANEYGIFEKGR